MISKLLIFLIAQSALAAQWEVSALKLGGERALREEGIQDLKKMSELDEKLRLTFGRRREELAFEVIRALDLRKFFPRLIGIIEKSKGEKLNWRLVRTVNSIASIEDRKRLAAVYEAKLREKDVPPPVLLALLAGLKRVDHRVMKSDLESLLKHSSFEVRIASAQAAGYLLRRDPLYGSILSSALSSAPWQLRLVGHQELRRLPTAKSKYRAELASACAKESNEVVRAICRKETQ